MMLSCLPFPAQSLVPVEDVTHLGAVPGVRDTVWDQVQLAVPSNPKLKRNATADVVVVGAGIAGLSVAYNLAKAGKKVIVLESRAIGDNSFFLYFFLCQPVQIRLSAI